MKNFTPLFFTRFSAALLATTALGSAALAQSLPDIAPEQIASDVERRYDNRTGQTEYVGGSFDPFESDPELAGSVSLRSAGSAVTIDGDVVSGGAFLDIAAIYTANSPDSFDIRGFEEVDFMSGRPADIVRYDSQTLDCSRSTREVTYDDSYYRGASYGYIAGIYRIYPRYRGHRNFGWDRGHWRRGNTSTVRRGYRGHGSGTDVRRRRGGHDDSGVTRRRTGSSGDVTRRRRSSDDTNVTRRRRGGTGDNDVTHRPRTGSDDGDVTRRRRGGTGSDEPRPRRRTTRSVKSADQPIVYRRPPNVEAATGQPARRSRPERRRPSPATSASTPKASTPPVSRRPVSRPSRPQRTERAAPTRSAPAQPRAASKPSRPPVSRPARARTNRAVDQTFKTRNPRSGTDRPQRRYFPVSKGYSQTDVYVNYRCVKEETLTVHIPQERLEAARFDGFAVMLVDNAGREVPVFVPPNYVEGFRMAAGKDIQDRSQSSVTYGSSRPDYSVRSTPAPRSSKEPIIYGDPGYPQE